MSKVTIEEIEIFLRVAQCKNFSRASEELFISQPTVTKWIQHLEKELGLSLFERNSKSVCLTEAGEFFYSRFSTIVEEFHDTTKTAMRLYGNEQITITIGALHGYDYDFDLASIIQSFSEKHPNIIVNFEIYNLSELNRKLNDLDFIFTNNLELDYIKDYNITNLEDVELCLAISKEHMLSRKRAVSMTDIAEETYYVLSENNSASSMDYASMLFPLAAKNNKLVPVTNVQSQMMNVAWKKGVALVSKSLIRGYEKDIHLVHIKDLPIEFKKIIAYKKKKLSFEEIALLKHIKDYYTCK